MVHKAHLNIALLAAALLSPALLLRAKDTPQKNTQVAQVSAQDVAATRVKASKNSKLSCMLLALSTDEHVLDLIRSLKFDLEFTDQMAIDSKKHEGAIDEKAIGSLFKQGVSLLLELEVTKLASKKKAGSVRIHVYDTHSKMKLFKEDFSYSPSSVVIDSHQMAEKILPALTGQPSPLSGTLAYCKQYSALHKVICVSDVTGKKEQVVVPNLTLNVAPRWHSKAPVLFFSQFSQSNTRLKSVSLLDCKQKTICSYDGLNMQPSFSDDGKQVVLCMSAKTGNSEIYLYDRVASKKAKRRVFRQLTHNGGNNSCPCMLPNGNIIFCSDFQTGNPQIYLLNPKAHTTLRITNGKGYCAAPTYDPVTDSVAYTKLIDGVFQIFSINLGGNKHKEKQLSFGPGDKLDPAWSPCGRYVAFTYDKKDLVPGKRIPQIAVLNCASKAIKVVTHGTQPKSFPAWVNKDFYKS